MEIALPAGRKQILGPALLVLLQIPRKHFCTSASCYRDCVGNTVNTPACVEQAEVLQRAWFLFLQFLFLAESCSLQLPQRARWFQASHLRGSFFKELIYQEGLGTTLHL